MQLSIFIALFLPCAGMSAIFVVYMCLLCYSARASSGDDDEAAPAKPWQKRGLSASDLQKLATVTGKDLVLATDCAICLDEIEPQQPARMVPGCNHGFHLKCADAWLSKNPICPLCRAKIAPHLFNSNPSQITQC